MLSSALDVLDQLKVLQSIQFIAIAISAIFVYRYFTDR